MSTNAFSDFFYNNQSNSIHKWVHYLDIYERHLNKFKDKDINYLEIGISQGGSKKMWQAYFGPKSHYYGIDIEPRCKQFEDEYSTIYIGDQGDSQFIENVLSKLPELDFIIDDGSHIMSHQIDSFQKFFPLLKEGGVYICEDIHTSYLFSYRGGFRRKKTFIEFTKSLIDSIHGWHRDDGSSLKRFILFNERNFQRDFYTKNLYSMHCYDAITVFDRKTIKKPIALKKGVNIFESAEDVKISFLEIIKNYLLYIFKY